MTTTNGIENGIESDGNDENDIELSNNNESDDSNSNENNNNSNKDDNDSKIGYDKESNKLMPGFEDVVDELLSFSSDSDFKIFNRQINSEIPLQRLVAVKRLASSCSRFGIEAALSLIQRIKNVAGDKEMVIRQTCAEQLGPYGKYLIESCNGNKNLLSRCRNIIIKELLPLIKDMLRDAMEVRQAASTSLIIIAELLSKDEVYEHVLKIVLHMAHDDSDDQKITALPLLGDLAPIVGSGVCKNYLSSDFHALSQDNSFRVRKATVQYFGPICEQLGADDSEKILLPIFKQLCQDSIWSVRKGCVESFVDISNSINQNTRASLIQIMIKFLTDTSRWVRNTAYEKLGPFISTLKSSQIKEDFLKYFIGIPHLSSAEADADCTNHCAFNFPSVTLTLGKERWDELNDTYNILVRKTFKSRKTLACSIHEICNILGQELTEKYLINSIEFFLKDIDDIREGIIKNYHKILYIFSDKKREEHLSILWELASESDVNWRFRLLLSQQLDEIIPLYNNKQVIEQLMPLTFQLCDDRMADVRYSAVKPVAELIYFFLNDNKNFTNIISKCNEIYNARTYSKRLLYIKLCQQIYLSKKLNNNDIFIKHFYNNLINYSKDRISNVRFALARFINDYILQDNILKSNKLTLQCIEILKNDKYDVEVRRFFNTQNEIESFLYQQKLKQQEELLKQQEEKQKIQQQQQQQQQQIQIQQPEINQNNDNQIDEDVEDDDDIGKDDDDNNNNKNQQNENNDNIDKNTQDIQDDESSSSSIVSTSDEEDFEDDNDNNQDKKKLLNMPLKNTDNLEEEEIKENKKESEQNKLSYKQSKLQGTNFDTELIHSPTPYRLPGLGDKDDDDDDDDNDDINKNNNTDNSNKNDEKDKNNDNQNENNDNQNENDENTKDMNVNENETKNENQIQNETENETENGNQNDNSNSTSTEENTN